MASDEKVLIRVGDDAVLLERVRRSATSMQLLGPWAEVQGLRVGPSDVYEGERAAQMALKFGWKTVLWRIHSVVDQIWLQCFVRGKVVRELRYTREDGWVTRRGAPLDWEAHEKVARLTRKEDLFATPDG